MVAAAACFLWWALILGLAFLDDRLYTAADVEHLELGFVHMQSRSIARRNV
jgi:hypothetical protein